MKLKTILIAVIAVMTIANAYSQTTLEEYNYLSKGYKIQIESGLDMKKGYEIKDNYTEKTSERTVNLKTLYRVNGNVKTIAAYLFVYNKNGKAKQYICIPNPQSTEEILNKYWSSLAGEGDSTRKLQLILYVVTTKLEW